MAGTLLNVVGARPQFVKAAPVSHALKAANIREVLVHTGQHFDPAMSDVFFDELEIPTPAYNLEVAGLGHGAMTGRMLEKLEQVMQTEKPSLVVIYGDTNSTVAAALAAAKLHIPVAHVEAGLRSFNRRMPEEINRVVSDHLSALLFCPTKLAVQNLNAEGITKGIHAVGDVMFDSTIAAIRRSESQSQIMTRLRLQPTAYAVCTIHRAENTDDPQRFAKLLAWLGKSGGDQPIIMPVHPRTRKRLDENSSKPAQLRLIDPLGYLDMTQLMHHAAAVFTESGGLQKEAYFHKVPCVTLRDETEWVETIDAGWNRLWTTNSYKPRREITEYGAGDSAKLIVEVLAQHI